jgi:alkylhydroperoxidase family enzyme
MARIPPAAPGQIDPEAQAELDRQLAAHGRVTNMKRTLAHSPTALKALMQWYDMHTEVVAFLGTRLTTLFAHAISSQTDCLICSTFFRRWLAESGENPDALRLDERDRAVVEYGRQLARDANAVSDGQFEAVARHLEPAQVVTLTAFGGLMIATNVFNNALRVDLDEYLWPFRKGVSG